MWIEMKDYMIRDTEEGQFQVQPTKYGRHYTPHNDEKHYFPTLKEAREWIKKNVKENKK